MLLILSLFWGFAMLGSHIGIPMLFEWQGRHEMAQAWVADWQHQLILTIMLFALMLGVRLIMRRGQL